MSVQSDMVSAEVKAAGGHPLRMRILRVLIDARVPMSPNELARVLGEPLGNVAYHVRILAEGRMIELVRTEPRRGAVEHFYRASVRAAVVLVALEALR